MSRIVLIVAGTLMLAACGNMTPEQADRMAALGRSMQQYGYQQQVLSQPRPVYYQNAPGTVVYCGTDGLGHAHFCY